MNQLVHKEFLNKEFLNKEEMKMNEEIERFSNNGTNSVASLDYIARLESRRQIREFIYGDDYGTHDSYRSGRSSKNYNNNWDGRSSRNYNNNWDGKSSRNYDNNWDGRSSRNYNNNWDGKSSRNCNNNWDGRSSRYRSHKPIRCFICNRQHHLAKDCPMREKINILLEVEALSEAFTSGIKQEPQQVEEDLNESEELSNQEIIKSVQVRSHSRRKGTALEKVSSTTREENTVESIEQNQELLKEQSGEKKSDTSNKVHLVSAVNASTSLSNQNTECLPVIVQEGKKSEGQQRDEEIEKFAEEAQFKYQALSKNEETKRKRPVLPEDTAVEQTVKNDKKLVDKKEESEVVPMVAERLVDKTDKSEVVPMVADSLEKKASIEVNEKLVDENEKSEVVPMVVDSFEKEAPREIKALTGLIPKAVEVDAEQKDGKVKLSHQVRHQVATPSGYSYKPNVDVGSLSVDGTDIIKRRRHRLVITKRSRRRLALTKGRRHRLAISKGTTPSSDKQRVNKIVCGFLWLLSPLRESVATIAGPNNQFINGKGDLDKVTKESLSQLKQALQAVPVLTTLDVSKGLSLTTDASNSSIGAILEQVDRTTKEVTRVLRFMSKKLQKNELQWPIRQKAWFSIIAAWKHWKHFLHGREFVIFNDHKSFANSVISDDMSYNSVGLQSWKLYLTKFNYVFFYIKGGKNYADRLFSFVYVSNLLDQQPLDWGPIPAQDYLEDSYTVIWKVLQEETATSPERRATMRHYRLGQLYEANHVQLLFRFTDEEPWRMVIPAGESRIRLLTQLHKGPLAGHAGADRVLLSLQNAGFYWCNMMKSITQFIQNCTICATTKYSKMPNPGLLLPSVISEEPWSEIGMDLLTGFSAHKGLDFILEVTDKFIKRCEQIFNYKDDKAEDVANPVFKNVDRYFGWPKRIIFERDALIISNMWKTMCVMLGITRKVSTKNNAQSDGQTENLIKSLAQTVRSWVIENGSDWLDYLYLIERSFDTFYHAVFDSDVVREIAWIIFDEIHYTRDKVRGYDWLEFQETKLEDIRQHLVEVQARQAIHYDKDRSLLSFKTGDYASVQREAIASTTASKKGLKFETSCQGPLESIEVLNDNAYKLNLNRGKVVTSNVKWLRKFKSVHHKSRVMEDNCYEEHIDTESVLLQSEDESTVVKYEGNDQEIAIPAKWLKQLTVEEKAMLLIQLLEIETVKKWWNLYLSRGECNLIIEKVSHMTRSVTCQG